MKTYFTIFFTMIFAYLMKTQAQETAVQLKQINVVKTNYRDLKSGDIVNKTISFQDGKLTSIKTSDVIQNFFYNQLGLLDRSVKEKEGSNWKEVINYSYDSSNRLTKLSQKYEQGGEITTKTVTYTYEGSRIKAITKKSITQNAIVENIEYIVENGLVVRSSARDRNEQIINKKEYVYYKGNVSQRKGLFGDKSSQFYTFDDKYSADLLIVSNIFGENYRVIVPIVASHEQEFDLQMISESNELTYRNTAANDIIRAGKFTYNKLNYPATYSLTEDNGMLKTAKTYIYE